MTSMKSRILVVLLTLVLCAVSSAWADPPSIVGRLNLLDGAVSFHPGSLDEWAPAVLNYPLTAGDHLWADDGSRAEVHAGSAVLRLGGGTGMSFLNLDDQVIQVAVSQGQLNVKLRRLDPGDAFEIDTPNSVFTIVQPGSYSVSVQSEEGSSITVWDGQAEVTAAGNDFMVPQGQEANVSGLGSIAYYTQPASSPDAWDAWCADRDAQEDQLVSVRYVPREMVGIEDLDANGSWTVMAGYGAVWSPYRVPAGWAPYKHGHWSWVAPWGWTWIDDAPWGFAPFHYGRWAFINTRWGWIPGTVVARPVYAPALVVFIGGGPGDPSAQGIGWFPLGPREVYVPPYGASPTYVQRLNVTNVTTINVQIIQQIDVTQVTYVNRTVPSAVTVVGPQTFTQGRPTNASTFFFSQEQVRRGPIIGMGATFGPQRESIIGQQYAGRNPPPQPPAQVMGRSVFGRIAPAPAPAPFTARQDPLPPTTVYRQPPPQQAPAVMQPQRQQAPIRINPQFRPAGQQPPPQVIEQPQPQRQPPQVIQPQRQPGPVIIQQPQPQMRPQPQPRPQQGQVIQAPPPAQPQPIQQQPPQPRQPGPGIQQPPRPGNQQQMIQPQGGDQPQFQGNQQRGGQDQGNQQRGGQDQGQGNQSDKDNKGRGEARSLLNDLKLKTLPAVQGHLDAARRSPGSKLDANAFAQKINAARSAITAAENTLSAGKSDAALQQAQAVQGQLADLDRQISDASRSSGGDERDKPNRR